MHRCIDVSVRVGFDHTNSVGPTPIGAYNRNLHQYVGMMHLHVCEKRREKKREKERKHKIQGKNEFES